MVYTKYIKRGRKLHGPYFYESVRDSDGRVKNIYLGKSLSPKQLLEALKKKCSQNKYTYAGISKLYETEPAIIDSSLSFNRMLDQTLGKTRHFITKPFSSPSSHASGDSTSGKPIGRSSSLTDRSSPASSFSPKLSSSHKRYFTPITSHHEPHKRPQQILMKPQPLLYLVLVLFVIGSVFFIRSPMFEGITGHVVYLPGSLMNESFSIPFNQSLPEDYRITLEFAGQHYLVSDSLVTCLEEVRVPRKPIEQPLPTSLDVGEGPPFFENATDENRVSDDSLLSDATEVSQPQQQNTTLLHVVDSAVQGNDTINVTINQTINQTLNLSLNLSDNNSINITNTTFSLNVTNDTLLKLQTSVSEAIEAQEQNDTGLATEADSSEKKEEEASQDMTNETAVSEENKETGKEQEPEYDTYCAKSLLEFNILSLGIAVPKDEGSYNLTVAVFTLKPEKELDILREDEEVFDESAFTLDEQNLTEQIGLLIQNREKKAKLEQAKEKERKNPLERIFREYDIFYTESRTITVKQPNILPVFNPVLNLTGEGIILLNDSSGVIVQVGYVRTLNLTKFFIDRDPLTYLMTEPENVKVELEGDMLYLRPDLNLKGKREMTVIAADAEGLIKMRFILDIDNTLHYNSTLPSSFNITKTTSLDLSTYLALPENTTLLLSDISDVDATFNSTTNIITINPSSFTYQEKFITLLLIDSYGRTETLQVPVFINTYREPEQRYSLSYADNVLAINLERYFGRQPLALGPTELPVKLENNYLMLTVPEKRSGSYAVRVTSLPEDSLPYSMTFLIDINTYRVPLPLPLSNETATETALREKVSYDVNKYFPNRNINITSLEQTPEGAVSLDIEFKAPSGTAGFAQLRDITNTTELKNIHYVEKLAVINGHQQLYPVFAVNHLNISNATIILPKIAPGDVIVKCEDWNFQIDVCEGDWQQTGIEYDENSTHLWFMVDGFTAYTTTYKSNQTANPVYYDYALAYSDTRNMSPNNISPTAVEHDNTLALNCPINNTIAQMCDDLEYSDLNRSSDGWSGTSAPTMTFILSPGQNETMHSFLRFNYNITDTVSTIQKINFTYVGCPDLYIWDDYNTSNNKTNTAGYLSLYVYNFTSGNYTLLTNKTSAAHDIGARPDCVPFTLTAQLNTSANLSNFINSTTNYINFLIYDIWGAYVKNPYTAGNCFDYFGNQAGCIMTVEGATGCGYCSGGLLGGNCALDDGGFAPICAMEGGTWISTSYDANKKFFAISNITSDFAELNVTGESLDSTAPSITLNSPANNTFSAVSMVNFTYTPYDASNIANCSLYINGVRNLTNTTIGNNVVNNFTLTFVINNTYDWAVGCYDSSSSKNFNITANRTIIVSRYPWLILHDQVSSPTLQVELADIDNDNDYDLIEMNQNANLSVYRNDGTGDFTWYWNSTTISGAYTMGVFDWENDGDLDIIVSNRSMLYIFQNNGTGTFILNRTNTLVGVIGLLAAKYPPRMQYADFNNDGYTDIVLMNDTLFTYVYNAPGKNFSLFSSTVLPSSIMPYHYLDTADMDDDGFLDLVVIWNGGLVDAGGMKYQALIYRNLGNGTFVLNDSSGVLYCGPPFRLAEVNGDGKKDIICLKTDLGDYKVQLYLNNGTTYPAQPTSNTSPFSSQFLALDVGDYDNDGFYDALVGTGSGGRNYLFTLNATYNFTQAWNSTETPDTRGLAVADLDRDGDLDAVFGNHDGNTTIYLNTMALSSVHSPPSPPTTFTSAWGTGFINLSWGNGSDSQTGSSRLYYNVRVGTTTGGNDIVSGYYGTPLTGFAKSRNLIRLNISNTQNYFWSVQTIDSAFNKSAWSTEQRWPLNSAPDTPNITINSTYGTNYTNEDLHCVANIYDPDNNTMNVTVMWIHEGFSFIEQYNNNYANGTLFNATLGAGNTSVGDIWSCSMQLYDGALYSAWGNSSNLTIRPFYINLTINKTYYPTIVIAGEATLMTATAMFKINDTVNNISWFNFTDEISYGFTAPSLSDLTVSHLNFSDGNLYDITSKVNITVVQGNGTNISKIEVLGNATFIGYNLSINDSIRLYYNFTTSQLDNLEQRNMTTYVFVFDTIDGNSSTNITTNITATDTYLKGYKIIQSNPLYPANVTVNIYMQAVGGDFTGILFTDYLPDAITAAGDMKQLSVQYYNASDSSYTTLVNDTDYQIYGPTPATLPDGLPASVFYWNLSTDSPANWDNFIYANCSIIVNYTVTLLGGGQWVLPTIIGGWDPEYQKHIQTEIYTSHSVPSFDVVLDVITPKIEAGGVVKGLLRMLNVGGPKAKVDVFINYAIKTMKGALITERSQTIAVVEKKEVELELPTPESIEPGMYTFETFVTYTQREAMSTGNFEVVGMKKEESSFDMNYGIWLVVGMNIIILVVVFVRTRKKKDIPKA